MKIAICFDLDGTLTKEEILPKISKSIGLFEEIDLLTKITMDGLITFDKSFKLRVKLLSSVPISKVRSIIEGIKIDNNLRDFINKYRDNCYIVTGNLDVWVNDFIVKNYGCNYFSSISIHNDDTLIGISHILNKAEAVNKLKEKYNTVISVGDGMNDCPMFEISDMSIAYGGTHQPVSSLIKMSNYVCYDSKTLVELLTSLINL